MRRIQRQMRLHQIIGYGDDLLRDVITSLTRQAFLRVVLAHDNLALHFLCLCCWLFQLDVHSARRNCDQACLLTPRLA